MDTELYCKIQKAKLSNKESIMEIVEMFMPLVKKYSKNLNFDGADTDLIISLISILNLLPNNLKEDKIIISYIAVSMKHEYIRLSKKHDKIIKTEVPLDEYILESQLYSDEEGLILLNELLDKLPKIQKDILTEIFINGCSEINLAKKLTISRQAVNKTKRKALKFLRKYIEL